MTTHPAQPHFLILYSTYTTTFVGLFKADTLCGSRSTENKTASANTLNLIQSLLDECKCSLTQLSFIGIYQGPGPFTSLRVTLALAHGLLCATTIPLIGVDGFLAFASAWTPHEKDSSEKLLVLLDAFCNEVYYALFDAHKKLIFSGYGPLETLTSHLATLPPDSITLVGNAQASFIQNYHNEKASGSDLTMPSLETIGAQALINYRAKPQGDGFLQPLYLKRPAVYKTAACPSQQ